jgi:hypothetical protein
MLAFRFLGVLRESVAPWLPFLELAVLAFTAYWIVLYTRETQRLREDAFQQRIDSFRPVIVFELDGPYKFAIKNIGKGAALDIELRLSQVHPNGGLTNLRNFIGEEAERNLLNLGENGRAELGSSDNVRAYAFAQEPDWRWGQRDVFAAIATYSDINRRPYYSVSLVHTLPIGAERRLVIKSTKTAYYGSGNIEKLNVLDWLK